MLLPQRGIVATCPQSWAPARRLRDEGTTLRRVAFEDITEIMWRHDGIMRTRALVTLGVSKHRQALAVDAGVVERVGRSWLAVPGTDRYLKAAARAGVVLTCVTQEVMRGLSLPPAARALCDEAVPWSDSGLESFVVPRLAWLKLPITPQVWIAGHQVDFLIGDRLVFQIDGGHHVGAQRSQDVAHDAELMLLGYHVVRVTYALVMERWHEVQAQLMMAVAQGLHRAPEPRHSR